MLYVVCCLRSKLQIAHCEHTVHTHTHTPAHTPRTHTPAQVTASYSKLQQVTTSCNSQPSLVRPFHAFQLRYRVRVGQTLKFAALGINFLMLSANVSLFFVFFCFFLFLFYYFSSHRMTQFITKFPTLFLFFFCHTSNSEGVDLVNTELCVCVGLRLV